MSNFETNLLLVKGRGSAATNVRRIVAVFGIAIRVHMKLTLVTGVWRYIAHSMFCSMLWWTGSRAAFTIEGRDIMLEKESMLTVPIQYVAKVGEYALGRKSKEKKAKTRRLI